MLNALKDRQRKLIAYAKKIKYTRNEFDFINSKERLIALIGPRGVGKQHFFYNFYNNIPSMKHSTLQPMTLV